MSETDTNWADVASDVGAAAADDATFPDASPAPSAPSAPDTSDSPDAPAAPDAGPAYADIQDVFVPQAVDSDGDDDGDGDDTLQIMDPVIARDDEEDDGQPPPYPPSAYYYPARSAYEPVPDYSQPGDPPPCAAYGDHAPISPWIFAAVIALLVAGIAALLIFTGVGRGG